ncbi:TPA: hypothetical protein ACYU9I_005224, partial [Klebsiella pneumoniae]
AWQPESLPKPPADIWLHPSQIYPERHDEYPPKFFVHILSSMNKKNNPLTDDRVFWQEKGNKIGGEKILRKC